MILKNIVFVFMLFITLITNAQSCSLTLKGTLTDFHDGQQLADAQIYIKEINKGFATNSAGNYRIESLCAGTYTLYITHLACEPKEVKVALTKDTDLPILMEHHIGQLQTVRVTADVHDNHNATQSITRVNAQTLQQYSAATLGDALATVSGVTTLKTGNSVTKPVIHGLYGSRVAIVHNGMRQQDQEWGVEHAPTIDVNTASTIEVVKGASALRYGGDAVAGTIIIEPARYIATNTLHGKAILQGQSNGRGGTATASVERFRKSGWYQLTTATYKKLGDYESPDYVLSNTGATTAAVNASLGYHKFEYGGHINYSFYDTTLGILRASHIGNAADLVRSINDQQPQIINSYTYEIAAPRQEVQHHALQANFYKRFSNLGKLSLDYSIQLNNRKEYDIRRGANANLAALDIDLQTQTVAAHLLLDSSDSFTTQIGVDGMFQVNSPNAATGIRRLIPDYKSYKVGAFVSTVYKPSDVWVLDGGLRYDRFNVDAFKFYLQSRWQDLGYDSQFPQFEINEQGNQILTNPRFDYDLFAGTIGAKRIINDHYDLAFNVSMSQRAPNVSELFSDGLHHALATIELGQLDLKKEQSVKVNTTFHARSGTLDVEVNPYVNVIQDFIQLVPTGIETTIRGAFPVYQYEQVHATMAGIDVAASYDFYSKRSMPQTTSDLVYNVVKVASIDTRLSYIYGQNASDDEPLIDMPPAQAITTLQFYNVWKSLRLTVANELVATQQRFPNYDYTVAVPNDDGTSSDQLVGISQPPAGYALWNLGAHYSLKSFLKTTGEALFSFQVANVFNTQYRNYLNRQRFYAGEVGRNISLQMTYTF